MRWVVVLALVASCDRMFGLNDVGEAPADASSNVDAMADAADQTIGCASGTRAALLDTVRIAGCSGSWTTPGLTNAKALCSPGWHICADGADAARNGLADQCGTVPSGMLFATLQGSSSADVCDGGGNNDIFGCGVGIGATVNAGTCGGLDAAIGTDTPGLGEWSVGTDATHELLNVTKGLNNGGVLCCKDTPMN